MSQKTTLKLASVIILTLSASLAFAQGMRQRNQGTGTYTPPPSAPPAGAFSVACPNALCTFSGTLPAGTTKVRVTGSGAGNYTYDIPVSSAGGGWSFTLPSALSPSGNWSFNLSLINDAAGTQVPFSFPAAVAVWQAPTSPSAPTASCVVGSCTVTGVIPVGATGVTINGSGPNSSTGTASATGAAGSSYSVTVPTTTAGNWTFTATATNPGSATTVSSASPNATVPAAAAAALAAGSTVDASQLTAAGINSTYLNDLSSNNTCGASGNQNCLAVFNSTKSASGCTLAGGGSATAAQMSDYVSCVMRGSHTAVASSIVASNVSKSVGCSAPAVVPLPVACSQPQWSCTVTNLPSGWTQANNSLSIPSNTTTLGSTTLNFTLSLNIYSPAYSVTKSFAVDVVQALANNTNGNSQGSYGPANYDVWNAFDSCKAGGGRLMTKAEFNAAYSTITTNYLFAPSTSAARPSHPDTGAGWCNRSGDGGVRIINGSPYCNGSALTAAVYYGCTGRPVCPAN